LKKILLPIILGIFVFALIWGFSGAGDDSGAKAKFKTTESASDKIWIAGDQGGGPRAIDKQIDGLYPNPSPAAHEEEEGLAADVTQEKKPIHDTLKEDVWGSKADEEDVLAADTWGEAKPKALSFLHAWMTKPTIAFERIISRTPNEAQDGEASLLIPADSEAKPTIKFDENENRFPTLNSHEEIVWFGAGTSWKISEDNSLTIGATKPKISFLPAATGWANEDEDGV